MPEEKKEKKQSTTLREERVRKIFDQLKHSQTESEPLLGIRSEYFPRRPKEQKKEIAKYGTDGIVYDGAAGVWINDGRKTVEAYSSSITIRTPKGKNIAIGIFPGEDTAEYLGHEFYHFFADTPMFTDMKYTSELDRIIERIEEYASFLSAQQQYE